MSDFDFGVIKKIEGDIGNQIITGCNINQTLQDLLFEHVSFEICNLRGTRFDGCIFNDCNFHKMILGQAVFFQCDLKNTKFYHATWDTLLLVDCDLTNVEFKDFDEPSTKPFVTLLLNCNTTNTKFENYDMSQIKMIDCFLT